MRAHFKTGLTLLSAAVLASVAPVQGQEVSVAPVAALPGWMAGTWEMQDGAGWSDEYWTLPRGGVMLGVARSGFGPKLDTWEHTRIAVKPDGRISFYAQPFGRAPTEFAMTLAGPDSIEFTNTANEYPQRIRYARQGQLLLAEISRIDGSRPMRWTYRPLVNPAVEDAVPGLAADR